MDVSNWSHVICRTQWRGLLLKLCNGSWRISLQCPTLNIKMLLPTESEASLDCDKQRTNGVATFYTLHTSYATIWWVLWTKTKTSNIHNIWYMIHILIFCLYLHADVRPVKSRICMIKSYENLLLIKLLLPLKWVDILKLCSFASVLCMTWGGWVAHT